MSKKIIIIFSIFMLSACAQNMHRPSGNINRQQAATQQIPANPLTKKGDIELLQQRLKHAGFDPGPIDGQLGNKSYGAIRQFQKANGYSVDGKATTRLLHQLHPEYVQPSTASAKQPTYDNSEFGKETAIAAGVGAVAGAAIGAIFGGKKGALIGAASGAALGGATEVITNKERITQAKTEHQLNLSLDEIRQKNARLKQSISRAKNLIKEDKVKLQQIIKQVDNKTMSKAQAQQQVAVLKKNREKLQSTYDKAVATKQKWKQYAGASEDVDQEINKLNDEIALLKTQLDELDQLHSISRTG